MPPPFRVELKAHDPQWAGAAAREAERLRGALGDMLVSVHHIGSTSIPGLIAKPVLDMVPVVRSHAELDAAQGSLEALATSDTANSASPAGATSHVTQRGGGWCSSTATRKEARRSPAIWPSATICGRGRVSWPSTKR